MNRRARAPLTSTTALARAALALAAGGLALTGCGTTAADGSAGSSRPTTSASPTSPTSPTGRTTGTTTGDPTTPSTSPTTSTGAGAAQGFPLAQGLGSGADTHVEGPSPELPGLFLEEACNLTAWPGPAVDRLVARETAPESEVVRDLEVYPDAASAARVVDAVRTHVSACPHQTGGTAADELAYTVVATPSGPSGSGSGSDSGASPDDEVDYVATLPSGRPVGTVVRLVQVGRAVLGVTETGEWTLDSARAEVPRLARRNADLVARMQEFRAG